MAIEILDFPIKNGGSFHCKLLVHQRARGYPTFSGVTHKSAHTRHPPADEIRDESNKGSPDRWDVLDLMNDGGSFILFNVKPSVTGLRHLK